MTALERAARAIDPHAWAKDRYYGSGVRRWRRERSMQGAAAALRALREPDEAMLIAIADAEAALPAGLSVAEDLTALWQAAIDSILAEQAVAAGYEP